MFPHLLKRERQKNIGILAALIFACVTLSAQADYKDDIGYTALLNELGGATPNGAGVKVTQAEAMTGTSVVEQITYYHYLPTTGAYSSVSFSNPSNLFYPGAVSTHADMVGQLIYGDNSMGSGISTVTNYLADHWIGGGFLRTGTSSAPNIETNDVQNHSWVGFGNTADETQAILSRLDFAIERDDFVSIVGVNNGVGLDRPLLSTAYNVISVGVTSGNHSSTPATVQRPHIVAPTGTTSEATAIVTSAATLLIQQARNSSSANGERSETIKAIMLAGATKTEFANWSRTDTMPLDSVYGAGELNVYNNYHIMAAGEQTASATPQAVVAATGWDYNTMTANQTVSYYFNLASDSSVSIALTWNALYTVTGNNYDALTLSLANLDLYLFAVDENGDLTLVQSSTSAENLEYIWAVGLSEGKYVIQVKSASSGANYAVAWQSSAVPEPSTIGLLILGSIFALIFLRRRVVRA